MALSYPPTAEPTLRNRIIDSIIEHLKRQAGYILLLSGEIVVVDHENEPACPEGVTFVFPKGAIGVDPPDWLPEFKYNWSTNGKMIVTLLNPPRILLLEPDNHVIGAGMMAREMAARLNEFYHTEEEAT